MFTSCLISPRMQRRHFILNYHTVDHQSIAILLLLEHPKFGLLLGIESTGAILKRRH